MSFRDHHTQMLDAFILCCTYIWMHLSAMGRVDTAEVLAMLLAIIRKILLARQCWVLAVVVLGMLFLASFRAHTELRGFRGTIYVPLEDTRMTLDRINLSFLKSPDEKFILPPDQKSAHVFKFENRHKTLRKACRDLGQSEKSSDNHTLLRNHVNTRMHVHWCPIPKSGSTFLKQLQRRFHELQSSTNHGFNSTVNIIFVRNPYKRLLSGYIDKIFAINPIFWKAYSKLRPEKRCAYDITFSEFVGDMLKQNDMHLDINAHFRQMHKVCEFCDASRFTYLGKMETFMDDIVIISDTIGSLEHNQTREVLIEYGLNGVQRMIYRNVYNLFRRRFPRAKQCGLTLVQCLRVTWLRWQIRGFISYRFPLPAEAQRNNITAVEFYSLATRARLLSAGSDVAEGKDMAEREAYGSLSRTTKNRLKDYFNVDCNMFHYDSTPDFVFGNYRRSHFSFYHNKFE